MVHEGYNCLLIQSGTMNRDKLLTILKKSKQQHMAKHISFLLVGQKINILDTTEGRRMVHYGNKHNIDGWCCKSLKQNLKQIASQAIYP